MSANTEPDHYTGPAGWIYQRVQRELPAPARPWVARLRARKLLPWLRPEDVIFEFGAGQGWNLDQLPCRRRLGHDVSQFLAADLAALGIEFVPDPAALPPGSIDVVLLHHVLEHVRHPSGILEQARAWLRPAGRLLLYVPHERERRYFRYRPGEPNHHLFSWNPQTVGNLVADSRFRLESIRLRRYGYDRRAARIAVRLGLGEAGFRALRRIALALLPCWEIELAAQPAPA